MFLSLLRLEFIPDCEKAYDYTFATRACEDNVSSFEPNWFPGLRNLAFCPFLCERALRPLKMLTWHIFKKNGKACIVEIYG